jgi:tetratricopeptide (TPR) repeat protein
MIFWLLACGVGADIRTGKEALEEGDLVAAEAAWRSALQREPGNPEALYGLGWTWHLAGQIEPARSSFDQCIRQHPDYAPCYRGLGSVAMAEGNPAMARKRFEEALARAPEDAATQQSLGILELSTGQPAAALARFDQLLLAQPDRSALLQGRAEALLALERAPEAVEAATLALQKAEDKRGKLLALLSRARALTAVTADRVDRERCAETAPPIYEVLEEASRNLDEAEAMGVLPGEVQQARRLIQRRRGAVDDLCPGNQGRKSPGG